MARNSEAATDDSRRVLVAGGACEPRPRNRAARPGETEAALRAYQQARALRTARVVLQSRAVGEHVYHPEGAHAALRNAIMAAKSQAEWREALAWLYEAR